jgi:signal transduction histidine kinase/response regulator RpfG family c-di-GMP phosphodiesterase
MHSEKRPSTLLSTTAAAGVVAVWGVVRLALFRDSVFPLTYVLPLLLCVWTRRPWQLWSMVVAFATMAAWKYQWLLAEGESPERDRLALIATLANILLGAAIVTGILKLRDRLDARADEIQRQNHELETQAEELTQQNEEIRTQSEELARQATEIEAQAEELAQQNEELTHANVLLTNREEVLQAVVECSRLADRRRGALEEVCRRCLASIGSPGESIAVVERQGDVFHVLAQSSLKEKSAMPEEWPAAQSLAALVMHERRTAYVDDFTARPDLSSPFRDSPQCLSALMTPLLAGGEVAGVVAVCAPVAAHWTQEQFRLLEWAAAQCGLLYESRRWQEALEQRTASLEAANKAKDHFLATLSHELRTPLTPVLLTAGLLEEDARLPEDVVADVRMIQRNIAVQSRLIDDLLDLTRIARGKIDLNMQLVCLSTLLNECAQTVSAELAGAGLKLDLRLDLPHRAMVKGDGARLQQVFWNILTNSIKFSPENSTITLTAKVRDEGPHGSVEVTVTDQGPGISAEDIDRIFLPFEQSTAAATGKKGGLGLGLSIAKAIAELHDGSIHAWPGSSGGGGRFTVRLPLAKVEEAEDRGLKSADGKYSPPREGLRILLVEDHEDTGTSLHRLLERKGYRVEYVRSCEEAVARWKDGRFNLLISDLGLPDGTGAELLTKLRGISPDVPAVCMSGYGMEADITRSREAGFRAHLIKPVRFESLEAAIRKTTDELRAA